MRVIWIALLLIGCSAPLVQVAGATDKSQHQETVVVFSPRELNFSEYLLELQFLNSWAKQASKNPQAAQEALNQLRGGWSVRTDTQSFSIDTGWLTDQFEKLQKNPTSSVRDDTLQRLAAMKANAAAFQNEPTDTKAARQKLHDILARSEFQQVRGATWWDRFWFRVRMWIYRTLSKMFGSSSAPTVGRFFVWSLVGIAVLALAYFIFHTIRQNARLESIMPEVLPVSAKQWRVWLKEAREAAAQGLWREAVHLAYWGGISFLEESGMWRPDQARTPREYLRLLPADSQHRATLKDLTRRLEVTWYGNEAAGPETFSETVTNLEELGCRD
jgi:heme exporter protein D